MVATSSGTEKAAAKSSLGGYWKSAQIWVVIVCRPAGRPRIAGAPKRESEWRKARIKPPTSAGAVRGRVTVKATLNLLAPKMFAASSRSDEISSQTLAILAKTTGKLER